MATFNLETSIPDLNSVEADSFFIKEGFVQFQKRIRNDDVIIFAVASNHVESVALAD